MTDESRRQYRRDDEEEDFGPPLFADDADPAEERIPLGDDATGQLPHWTSPPTGEVPRTISTRSADDPTDELDVWSSFSSNAPVWGDDPSPTGEFELPDTYPSEVAAARVSEESDPSAPVRRPQGRITIGTDPTGDRTGRPTPGRGRSGSASTKTAARQASAAPTPSSGRDMPTAIAVGLLLVAAFVATLLVGPWAVMVIIVAILTLAAVEYFDKVTEKGYRPATVAGVVACAAAPLAAYWVGERALPLVLTLALAAGALTYIESEGLESGPLPNLSITMLGVVWIGVMGSFAALIVGMSNMSLLSADGPTHNVGTDTLFLLVLGVVANDIGALFIGSAAGRTPLRSWISPNKTVEGFLGGALMTFVAMLVVSLLGKSTTWNSLGDLLILAAVISIAAPIGDLTESMFKRNLGIKDFGTLVRGHGGVLDRFDGFLFALPAVYYVLLLLEPWVSA